MAAVIQMISGDTKIKERKPGEDGNRDGMIQLSTKKLGVSAEGYRFQ